MNLKRQAVLALWHDCAAEHHPEFERWYQTEHLYERLAIDGFLRGRRYESCGGGPQFFTVYETRGVDVLHSDEYLERLNNPTELTSRVMSGMVTNMSRTVCEVVSRAGRFRGAYACTVNLNAVPDASDTLLESLLENHGVASAQLWVAPDAARLPATAEEKLRGGDSRITACLLIELLREKDAQDVVGQVRHDYANLVDEIGCYQLICELEAAAAIDSARLLVSATNPDA